MLSVPEIHRLNSIIKSKGWPTRIGSTRYGYVLFDVASDFLSKFTGDERNLAFEFLEKYELIKEYTKKLEALLDQLPAAYFQSKCYIIPNATANTDIIKSGHAIAQWFKINIPRATKHNVFFPDAAASEIVKFDEATYLIVDDFVGSGRQFVSTFHFLVKNGVAEKSIKLAVICITERALQRIQSLGVTVHHIHSYKKAISDNVATGPYSTSDAHTLYKGMFSQIDLSKDFILGFGKCEMLLTMKATPNNTLPIFWADTAKGGGTWPAPFRR